MTNMKKYLKNVANPEDITGTSKKFEFEFTGQESVTYKKTIEIVAVDEDDAQEIAEQMCDDSEVGFDDRDMYDSDGFNEIECENMGEVD